MKECKKQLNGSSVLEAWLLEQRKHTHVGVEPIPFSASGEWCIQEGGLAHNTGRFFKISGLRFSGEFAKRAHGDQPIIEQPEIGILGVLLRRGSSGPELLLQAKAEPGNIDTVHLAPTVQATLSNYERVHGGKATPYLEAFLTETPFELDELQSEQGRFFLMKRNRNMARFCDGDVEVKPGYLWTPLVDVVRLLHVDHAVNSDLRSVLACMDWMTLIDHPPKQNYGKCLWASLSGIPGEASDEEVDSWWDRTCNDVNVKRQRGSLNLLTGWRWTDDRLEDVNHSCFWIRQMRIHAPEREVSVWDQPLVGCRSPSEEILLCKIHDGALYVLVALRRGPGVALGVEMGLPDPSDVCDCRSQEILSVNTSEEGGRFFQMVSHYRLRLVNGEWLPHPHQRWMTLRQIKRQISKENRVSNELRGALSLLLPFLVENSE